MERSSGSISAILSVYGIAITFVQVWITREAFAHAGVRAVLSTANSLRVYLQGILIGLGVMIGLVLLILPGLYVFARWYLANILLVRDGGGRRAAMRRSWDLLEVHWVAALGVGLILFALSTARAPRLLPSCSVAPCTDRRSCASCSAKEHKRTCTESEIETDPRSVPRREPPTAPRPPRTWSRLALEASPVRVE